MNEHSKAFRKILRLSFPQERADSPVMSDLVRKYDLTFSILAGQITPKKEGSLTISVEGSESNWQEALKYLRSQNIKVDSAAQHISRNEDSCMHCGLCTALCPADALVNDIPSRSVAFYPDKCTACGLCTKVCPVDAMQVDVENMLI